MTVKVLSSSTQITLGLPCSPIPSKVPVVEQFIVKDPMVRVPKLFGGLINDLKRRFPYYLSDFKDGLSLQVLSAIIDRYITF